MRDGDFVLIPAGTTARWDECYNWTLTNTTLGYVRAIRKDGSVEWTKPYEDYPLFVSPVAGIEALPPSCYIVTDEILPTLRGLGMDIEDFVKALTVAMVEVGVTVLYLPQFKEKGLLGGLEDLRATCGDIVMQVLWGWGEWKSGDE